MSRQCGLLVGFLFFLGTTSDAFMRTAVVVLADAKAEFHIYPGTFPSLPDAEVNSISKLSAKTWSNVSESKLILTIGADTNNTSTDFIIYNNSSYGAFGASTVAITEINTSGKTISAARIFFNPAFTMKNDASLPATASSNQFDLQMIMTHEMGHAIGLDHSAGTQSVMSAPALRANIRTLGLDDWWAAISVYPRNQMFPFLSMGCGTVDAGTGNRDGLYNGKFNVVVLSLLFLIPMVIVGLFRIRFGRQRQV